ncbi:hypothetical protein [Zobellia uliginosa]|uniref:hypothetical protein n=1 Tax=Zobellia uliginosa TaxID=143224 RepID=UPI001C07EB83|nr:hypothetical protein [Zobellia uliginosa]MBU2948113.1 hypothetical protein [Zobellia uliginosa]
MMKRTSKYIALLLVSLFFGSCVGEVKDKLSKAKEGVSNATAFVKEARKAEGRIEKLKSTTPLTNGELREWLPENLGNLKRTGFKIGQAGMYQVNSVEGTYKMSEEKKKFKVVVIDGAGPTGSMMAASYGLLGNFEMETEDEFKHQQTVEVNGVKAQQTYKKKTNDTQLMFAYEERFFVTVNGSDMLPDETWGMVEKLKLEELAN